MQPKPGQPPGFTPGSCLLLNYPLSLPRSSVSQICGYHVCQSAEPGVFLELTRTNPLRDHASARSHPPGYVCLIQFKEDHVDLLQLVKQSLRKHSVWLLHNFAFPKTPEIKRATLSHTHLPIELLIIYIIVFLRHQHEKLNRHQHDFQKVISQK